LIPRLGEIAGGPWLWTQLTPGELGDDPFLALTASLKPLLQGQGYDVRKIHDKLSNTGNIGHLVKTMLLKQPSSVELLLFVDQFEEFVYPGGRKASQTL
jgi:hypothetical protein